MPCRVILSLRASSYGPAQPFDQLTAVRLERAIEVQDQARDPFDLFTSSEALEPTAGPMRQDHHNRKTHQVRQRPDFRIGQPLHRGVAAYEALRDLDATVAPHRVH